MAVSIPPTGGNQKPKFENRWYGRALGYGAVGYDVYSRIKDGENPIEATGQALLTNALWMNIPWKIGIPAMIGSMAISMGPELMRAMDAVSSAHGAKKGMFTQGFQDTEQSYNMRMASMDNMMNARQHAVAKVANHARMAQKVY